jgi:hypothetical protein
VETLDSRSIATIPIAQLRSRLCVIVFERRSEMLLEPLIAFVSSHASKKSTAFLIHVLDGRQVLLVVYSNYKCVFV